MQDFKLGAKVRYFNEQGTPNMVGLEGTITCLYNSSSAEMVITKTNGNSMWNIGSAIYPDLDNLELVGAEEAEAVQHPAHYGGDTTYEVIKVAEAWGLDKDAYLFNVVKYVGRAGKKAKATLLEDLKKARFYLDRRIKELEAS